MMLWSLLLNLSSQLAVGATVHLLVLFCGLSYSLASTTVQVNEDNLFNLLKQGNHLVKRDQSLISSAEEGTGHLARSFLPELRINAGYESFSVGQNDPLTQPDYAVELKLNVYNGGREVLEEEVRQLNLKKVKSSAHEKLMEQLEVTRQTFWRTLYFKALSERLKSSIQLIRENEKAAKRRINSGIATKSDLFEFQIKQQELVQEKKHAKLAFAKQLGHLKVLLGLSQGANLELNQTFQHSSNWKEIVRHNESDHDYLLEEQKSIYELTNKLANQKARSWFPKLDAYAILAQPNRREEFDRITSSERRESAVGLRLEWRLSEGLNGQIRKRVLQNRAIAERHAFKYLQQEIDHEIHIEIEELELLDEMVRISTGNIERAKAFHRLIISEYKRGVKNSSEMLAATEKLIATQVRQLQMIRDFQFAKSHLLKKFGR